MQVSSLIIRSVRAAGLRAAIIVWLIACSSGGDSNGNNGGLTTSSNPGTLAVNVSPTSASITAGGESSNHTVTIARGGGFTGPVTLAVTGVPTNVTATLANTSLDAGTPSTTLGLKASASAMGGQYPLTITASGSGVTPAVTAITLGVAAVPLPLSFSFSVADSTLSIVAGASASLPIRIVRSGSFTGAVAFAVSGTPPGVVASIAPTSTSNDTARLTVVVSGTVATTTTATLTVRGSGSGVPDVSQSVALTITAPPVAGAFVLAVAPTAVAVTQGLTKSLSVMITRSGGFNGDVDVTVSGLPTGLTASIESNASVTLPSLASFAVVQGSRRRRSRVRDGTTHSVSKIAPLGEAISIPAAATGATIRLTASATAALTQFTLTVTATATGVPTQKTTVSGTINASVAIVNDDFCRGDSDVPVFYAMQDGATGAWIGIVPESTTTIVRYRIMPTQSKFATAVVRRSSGSSPYYTLSVFYRTSEELKSVFNMTHDDVTLIYKLNGHGCMPPTRILSGTITGLTTTTSAIVEAGVLGEPSGEISATVAKPSFTLHGLTDSPLSLFAARGDTTMGVVDRLILRRDLTGSAAGTLDFNGAEAFAPASARVSVRGLTAADTGDVYTAYVTDGSTGSLIATNSVPQIATYAFGWHDSPTLTAGLSTFPYYAIPEARLNANERQVLYGQFVAPSTHAGVIGGAIRVSTQVFQSVVDRTLTLGPYVATARLDESTNTPYRRPTITLPRQMEYGFYGSVTATSDGSSFLELQMSSGYAGSGDWIMPTPDLSAVPGWKAEYTLRPGKLTSVGTIAASLDPAAGTYSYGAFLTTYLPTNTVLGAVLRAARVNVGFGTSAASTILIPRR